MAAYGTFVLALVTTILAPKLAWGDYNGDYYEPHDDHYVPPRFHGPHKFGPYGFQNFGPHKPHGPHRFGPYKEHGSNFGPYKHHGPNFSPFKPYGPHHFGPFKPYGPHDFYHRRHHNYQPPHREPCDWFRKGPKGWDWDQNKSPRPPPLTSTTSTTSTASTNSSPVNQKIDCVLDCLLFVSREDITPVCGSNGVTYRNARTLECVKDCGEDIYLVHRANCKKDEDDLPPGAEARAILDCILHCPTTPEYNPVCGSDGLTYSNPGRLECAKMCGRDVDLLTKSRCLTDDTNSITDATPKTNATPKTTAPEVTDTIPSTTASVVTDEIPYTDATSTTDEAEASPAITNATPITNPPIETTPPETTANPLNTSPQTAIVPNFTIPQDLLDEIFTTEYANLIDVRRDEIA